MRLFRLAALPLVVAACLFAGRPAAQSPAVLGLLDRYLAGEHDAVVADLSELTDFQDLLKQLREFGPAWIEVRKDDAPRRELAAATFALEAARVDAWLEWKWVQAQPAMGNPENPRAGEYRPLAVLTWQAPPLFIEWGCERFRQHTTPPPIERWWQLGALAVAQRSEDPQFLIGDPSIGLGAGANEVGNLQKEIKHLEHATARFPDEARFRLAEGIAREWVRDGLFVANAMVAFDSVKGDLDVGAEATMRAAALMLRTAGGGPQASERIAQAMKMLAQAEETTRNPYVVYLARYFRAQAELREKKTAEAERSFRGAAAAVPNAQAASTALAALQFLGGRRTEAIGVAARVLGTEPPVADPWREYTHADDRFWPQIIARLRAEIAK